MSKLTKVEGQYPNTAYKYIDLFLDGVALGRADIERGGLVVHPGRKVYKTEAEAAGGMISRALKSSKTDLGRAQDAIAKWTALREKLNAA